MADLWEYGIKDVNDNRVDPFVFGEKVIDLHTNGGKNETIGYISRVKEMNDRLVQQGIDAQTSKNQIEAGHFVSLHDYGEMVEWFEGGWEKRPKALCKYVVVRRRVEAWEQAPDKSAWTKEQA